MEPAFLDVERSLSGARWIERSHDPRCALALSQILGAPEIVGRILAARGVTPEDVEAFMSPSLKDSLPDPAIFRDMEAAVQRLAGAVMQGERIAVFGDYDVDGATSSALLIRYFRTLGVELRIYIPDRLTEGYGPNEAAMRTLAAEGMKVLIAVDCGTLAFDALATAKECGMDVIVADHHKAEPELPPALAVINPNRLDETAGHKELAAVGVTFLLCVALNRELRSRNFLKEEFNLLKLLDLVALGTIADVVPLTGINRVLVTQGLKVMARRENPGIAALSDMGRIAEAPKAYHCGFVIGPRVNAGGRVGACDLGSRILSTDDPDEARALAVELDRLNEERRRIEDEVLQSAFARIDVEMGASADIVALAAGEGWHPGVVGIVASRLKDRYRRPAVVIGVEGGIGKGSARSVPGIDIGAAMLEALRAGLLIHGGGHAMAAGLTIAEENIAALKAFLNAELGKRIAAARLSHALKLDGAIAVQAATLDLVALLDGIGPYGAAHAEPRFVLPDVTVTFAETVADKHVRLSIKGGDGAALRGMAFRAADTPLGAALLSGTGKRFHLAGKLKRDDWGAKPRVDFILDDAARA